MSCAKPLGSGVAFAATATPNQAGASGSAAAATAAAAAAAEGGRLYCDECLPLRLGPACRRCGKPTPRADAVVALDAVWHRHCMRCEEPGCGRRPDLPWLDLPPMALLVTRYSLLATRYSLLTMEPGCGRQLADGYFEWQGGLRCRQHFLQHSAELCAR